MTERGPSARCASSPASAMRRRWSRPTRSARAGVPAGAMKTRGRRAIGRRTDRPPTRSGADRATARRATRRRRAAPTTARSRAPAPSPRRCWPADTATGEGVLAHADGTAAILRGDRCGARAAARRPTWSMPPTSWASPTRCSRRCSARRRPRWSATRASSATCSARRSAHGSTMPTSASRPSACARCCSPSRATCASCCCAWPRACRRCATSRPRKRACPPALAHEAMQVFAPLANRLGIWQIKWELEDLAFRFLDPDALSRRSPRLLDERRAEREARIARMRDELGADLAAHGIAAQVQGRPKHLYSIWKKMRRKGLDFERVLDVLALRVIVADVAGCYAVLGRVHERFRAVAGEFDDYIARPKANGYRSLHTVVQATTAARSRSRSAPPRCTSTPSTAFRRTGPTRRRMPRRRGRAAPPAASRPASPRRAWWCCASCSPGSATPRARAPATPHREQRVGDDRHVFDDRIYVFTPQATVVELAAGATPIDFAYAVHTDLGHRCRGAKVDGAMVPLDTPLRSGQTVEITAAKSGGPVARLAQRRARLPAEPALEGQGPRLVQRAGARRDRRARPGGGREAAAARRQDGAEAGRSRRAARLPQRRRIVRGRRQGRVLAAQHRDPAAPGARRQSPTTQIALRRQSRRGAAPGGVLVVGVESLLTSLARCCRPAPPDAIAGYVTRGKGVAVHRAGCSNLRELAARAPERVIPVAWGATDAATAGALSGRRQRRGERPAGAAARCLRGASPRRR